MIGEFLILPVRQPSAITWKSNMRNWIKGAMSWLPAAKERILRKQQRLCLKDMMRWSGGRLHPKKWNVRSDKFNHYCDIVDAFKKLMREQALLEHLILEDLLPSKKDEEDDDDFEEEEY